MVTATSNPPAKSPFDLTDDTTYRHWRDKKLSHYPIDISELIVEVEDPRQLSSTEHDTIKSCLQKTNFAIYASKITGDDDPSIPLALGRQFGLTRLDHNWLSDDTGLTSLKVVSDGIRSKYIPYSNRPIKWHTDGYYNPPERQIHSLLLHCVSPAATGGVNQLMDHEVAYILMRDEDPQYIKAFMDPEVLSIPPRYSGDDIARPNESGPVFSVTPQGELHMRLSLRAHNVLWKNDPVTTAALFFLKTKLADVSPYLFKGRLEAGMGLISRNILHDRTSFEDDKQTQRHLYRARYFDHITL